ncbi:hypothetical protein F5Y16DRAFT_394398 [Xylariaceae sp. FL0255]|nr:hypothetical protein F5Y16DRAFT_394398 [Xylariaceae sp. FL0255]
MSSNTPYQVGSTRTSHNAAGDPNPASVGAASNTDSQVPSIGDPASGTDGSLGRRPLSDANLNSVSSPSYRRNDLPADHLLSVGAPDYSVDRHPSGTRNVGDNAHGVGNDPRVISDHARGVGVIGAGTSGASSTPGRRLNNNGGMTFHGLYAAGNDDRRRTDPTPLGVGGLQASGESARIRTIPTDSIRPTRNVETPHGRTPNNRPLPVSEPPQSSTDSQSARKRQKIDSTTATFSATPDMSPAERQKHHKEMKGRNDYAPGLQKKSTVRARLLRGNFQPQMMGMRVYKARKAQEAEAEAEANRPFEYGLVPLKLPVPPRNVDGTYGDLAPVDLGLYNIRAADEKVSKAQLFFTRELIDDFKNHVFDMMQTKGFTDHYIVTRMLETKILDMHIAPNPHDAMAIAIHKLVMEHPRAFAWVSPASTQEILPYKQAIMELKEMAAGAFSQPQGLYLNWGSMQSTTDLSACAEEHIGKYVDPDKFTFRGKVELSPEYNCITIRHIQENHLILQVKIYQASVETRHDGQGHFTYQDPDDLQRQRDRARGLAGDDFQAGPDDYYQHQPDDDNLFIPSDGRSETTFGDDVPFDDRK